MDKIFIRGAREHNLKNIDVEIPKNKLVVFTGLSGSGKSSLAFDTIYAEGQRRYVESLSAYARQFLGLMKKPDVDTIEGLSPSISIDQKSTSHNPRSTVGTVTEIYDYMRLLFARVGHPHCPKCGIEITHQTLEQITDATEKLAEGAKQIKLLILAPVVRDRKGEYIELFSDLRKKGYGRVRIDGQIFSLQENFMLLKTNKHTIDVVIDRLTLGKKTDRSRLSESIEHALRLGSGEMIASVIKDQSFDFPEKPKKMDDHLFSEKFACPRDGISIEEPEPRMFSFNSPHGACPNCSGLGSILTADPDLVLNKELSISEGAVLPFSRMFMHDSWFSRLIKKVCEQHNISLATRLGELSLEKKRLLLYGTGNQLYEVRGSNRFGRMTTITQMFQGFLNELKEKYKDSESEFIRMELEKYMRYEICQECSGARLKKASLSVTIDGKSIMDVCDLSIDQTLQFAKSLFPRLSSREQQIARLLLKEIGARLSFLVDVGLDYITLSRSAQTLAGGEAQRIRLASQIGSGLTGVLYVLDEPSIGLHQRDNKRLIETLKRLRDLGNTVIVVEHDQETMESSDRIYDFGPGAGEHGGKIVAEGTIEEITQNKNSITGKYLSGEKKIFIEKDGKSGAQHHFELVVTGATEHNLKNVTVSFPLQKLVCITGVSGSGKSTLVHDILYHALMQKLTPYHKERPGKFKELKGFENIRRVVLIDQSPIGRTPRSNPATYTGAFTFVRELFAKTKEARVRGYNPGRFSFNVKGGRCEECSGEGQIKIEMQFLPDVFVPCEVCAGARYNREALNILYQEKNISEVLEMSVEKAYKFFGSIPGLSAKLETLNDVGLSYIKLGQPATTLSGGEAQRVKLATELSKRGQNILYLLDEPTTGLHFADLERLLLVLRKLVDSGNTVIIIEHNLDVVKNADWIIDLGPEGGEKGGEVVASGTPNDIVQSKSYTGQFLKKVIGRG